MGIKDEGTGCRCHLQQARRKDSLAPLKSERVKPEDREKDDEHEARAAHDVGVVVEPEVANRPEDQQNPENDFQHQRSADVAVAFDGVSEEWGGKDSSHSVGRLGLNATEKKKHHEDHEQESELPQPITRPSERDWRVRTGLGG